ncbi:MAG: protein kinase family protein [Planctomycetota bacterium]
MLRFEDRWKALRFNRLDFDKKYVIDQVLSQTPRSQVLLTRRRGGKRQSVMKLSDPGTFNPQEIECLRAVNHPGIVSYLGHGLTKDRRLWVETEYVDGVPLSAWRGNANSQPAETQGGQGVDTAPTIAIAATTILSRLIEVVQYLHCCGWLHGDLSPQNILISTNQHRVLLVDFERARSIHSAATMPPRKHSLAYASPWEIDGGTTTEACEHYALGKLVSLLLDSLEPRMRIDIKPLLDQATGAKPDLRVAAIRQISQRLGTP